MPDSTLTTNPVNQIYQQLLSPVSPKPLAMFRIVFGALMAWELIHYRFFRNEINDFLVDPTFRFTYMGMGWIPKLTGVGFEVFYWSLVTLFVLLSVGLLYRIVSVLCFVGWTWLFFMERTIYFNHWYLAVLLLFLLLLAPANQTYALDNKLGKTKGSYVPFWSIGSLALLTGLVYFFSGTAKLNPDWLFGQPLTLVFAQELGHLPKAFQQLMAHPSIGMAGSYITIILELLALPLLIWRRSRKLIVALLIGFNVLNLLFFPVGIFPLLIIALTLLWIPVGQVLDSVIQVHESKVNRQWVWKVLLVFFVLQLLLPARRLLYSGSQLWAEEGLLFSWPMFTTYKGGDVLFLIQKDQAMELDTIYPRQLDLTEGQYIRMVKNPDCILQYAQYLGKKFTVSWESKVAVYCDSYLHLNGRPVQRFIHPNVDLSKEKRRLLSPYPWVLPLEGTTRKTRSSTPLRAPQ